MSSLCLYNVMMMQIDHIRSNCQVPVNPIRQEIHSLGVNRYLLFSPESTTISFDCTSERKQVNTFEGQLYMTMVKDCPIAHTMGHTFSYTTSVHLQRDIVYLPTLYKIEKWLDDDTLSAALEENIISRMDEMLTSGLSDIDNFEDGIPLNTLIDRIRHRSSRIVMWYLAILQHVVAILAALYISYKLGLQFKEKLLPLTMKLPTCIRRRPTRYNRYLASKMFPSGEFLNWEVEVKCLGWLLCRLEPLWLRFSNLGGYYYWCLSM